ncbi:MAG: YkgJ family cysteine cluster protein [Candidatus Wallbacteria bacterium]|nr:YkgJ family cysteine cluster protein [Candidatus Wallbacteria bacterium]
MAYSIICPFCSKVVAVFNIKDSDCRCPCCGKPLDLRKLKKGPHETVECLCCGNCCRYVPELSRRDRDRLKKRLHNWENYIFRLKGKTFFRLKDGRGRLRESSSMIKGCHCVFFEPDTGLCSIHEFKPDQCRKLEAGYSCHGIKKPEIDFSRF